ncbi:MAG: D-alanyl-D-alanine carboxypeptidase [Spirochaetales bacterium]|nr:D-alanyl-D-alanine carboxypeptidase [Spirochaetales bacterium]
MIKKLNILIVAFILFLSTGLSAQNSSAGVEPPRLSALSALLVDYDTGRILYGKNQDKRIPPASMTKVMTLLLCYDAIAAGELSKDQIVTIDEKGSSFSRPPFSSLMLLEEGQEVSVLDLMKGLAISSGNDAAYAIAGLLGPDLRSFIDKMNERAWSLGMDSTVFVDPDGWSKFNMVTAEDFALLARAYISLYPEALEELHSQEFMVYPLPQNMPEGKTFRIEVPRKKRNTNLLLGRVDGVDGLKTGYIDESGFNFTGTAIRDGQRLISIIMGIRTDTYYQGLQLRAKESEMLLEYGFSNFSYHPFPEIQVDEVKAWYGDVPAVLPVPEYPAEMVLSREELERIESRIALADEVFAPLSAGTKLGSVEYYLDGVLLDTGEIVLAEDLNQGAWYSRLRDFFTLQWRALKEGMNRN